MASPHTRCHQWVKRQNSGPNPQSSVSQDISKTCFIVICREGETLKSYIPWEKQLLQQDDPWNASRILDINKQLPSVCLFRKSRLVTGVLFITLSLSLGKELIICHFCLHHSEAMPSGLLPWYTVSFQCSLVLSTCLHFPSLTPFRNVIKPSSFQRMMPNKANV